MVTSANRNHRRNHRPAGDDGCPVFAFTTLGGRHVARAPDQAQPPGRSFAVEHVWPNLCSGNPQDPGHPNSRCKLLELAASRGRRHGLRPGRISSDAARVSGSQDDLVHCCLGPRPGNCSFRWRRIRRGVPDDEDRDFRPLLERPLGFLVLREVDLTARTSQRSARKPSWIFTGSAEFSALIASAMTILPS